MISLIPATHLRGIKCPIGGHFVTSKDGCTVDISSACESPTEMKIATSCTGIKGQYITRGIAHSARRAS